MTHDRSSVLIVLFGLGFCFGTSQAQQNSPTRGEGNDAVRQKAFEVLESVSSQISTLQSPENRARVASNIADSIWDHDEKRARALLVSVQDDINSVLRSQAIGQPVNEQTRMVFVQLRINTVDRIAKHDGELALSFLQATEPDSSERSEDDQPNRDEIERAFELRLAKDIAAKNPELALNLGRRALARGVFLNMVPLLRELNRKHKEQARLLMAEIVSTLRRVNLANDRTAFYFARELAFRFAPPAIDDTTYHDLITLFANSAAANGCNGKMADDDERNQFCYEIASVLPLIKKVDPARAAQLQRWQSDYPEQYEGSYGYEDLSELAENGTVDEILALRSRYPAIEGQIYWRAIEKARAAGDIEQARKIASDIEGQPEMRQSMLEMIDRDQKIASELKEKQKELQETLAKLRSNEERIQFLVFVAMQFGPTDRKQATKLLDQASDIVDSMKPGKDQISAQILLALMYCSQKNDRGLSIMQSLVPKVNELVDAAAKLDGYENQYLRDGEWNMTRNGILGSLLTGLAENATYFAWCDFDRAVSIAGQFERPEIRLMAQLKLAQSILAGPPKALRWDSSMRYTY